MVAVRFGERKAVVTMAKENLMMANVGFNATHQQIVSQSRGDSTN